MVVTPLFQSVAAPETTIMKKIETQKTTTKVAIFAGAAVLMALTPQSHAQTSVDALLNKLEQKGILSVDEAKELKAENETNSVDDFNKALGAKFPTPDWVTSYKLYGDFRGRYDDINAGGPINGASSFNGSENQVRFRYRLRAGLTINMKDNTQVGFRLTSDDAASSSNTSGGGNPLSNNSTLQGNGTKKGVYVDAAYGKWTPINDGTWMVAGTIGKMDQPFQLSPMVFDPDYTPEGAALNSTYKINDNNSLAFNGAAFVINQFNTRDPFMYGGQVIWNANWTPKVASSLGLAALDIDNINQGAIAGGTTTDVGYDSNLGNTTKLVNGIPYLVNDYNPIIADASVTYTLDRFPLYPGAFPVKLAGEYMDNPGAANNNRGWWVGGTIGKSGKKGMWDITYRYQWLEADAWWDQVVDDDNIARFLTTPTSAATASAVGGTNIKGHLVKFNYSIFDSLTFTFTAYINDLINNPYPGQKTDAIHAMADLMWKF
jgi:hypothetical protein